MRVVLRVRPLSTAERGQKEREAVGCPPGQPVARLLTSVEAGRRVEAQEFAFDHVFPPAATERPPPPLPCHGLRWRTTADGIACLPTPKGKTELGARSSCTAPADSPANPAGEVQLWDQSVT